MPRKYSNGLSGAHMFFRRKCTPVLRAPRNCETCCERASKRWPSAAKRPAPSAATLYLARIRRQHPQVFRIHLTDTVLSNGWRELCSSATRSRYLLYAPLHSVLTRRGFGPPRSASDPVHLRIDVSKEIGPVVHESFSSTCLSTRLKYSMRPTWQTIPHRSWNFSADNQVR